MERMREVVKNGTTVLFVSHNVKAVMELCSRAILLDHGKMSAIGATDAVVQRYLNDGHSTRRRQRKTGRMHFAVQDSRRGRRATQV